MSKSQIPNSNGSTTLTMALKRSRSAKPYLVSLGIPRGYPEQSEGQINSNYQNHNSQNKALLRFRNWKLRFICNLVLGIWCLFSMFALILSFAQKGVANMKKVVMIIAQDDFRDEEYAQPREILERNGIEVKVASTRISEAVGMLGARVKPNILVSDINVKDFDAIVFVGGVGASQYWDDPVAHKLAEGAVNANRILAAICIAPVTLAKAGILKGKRATVWSSEVGQLQAAGANCTGRPVEKDGNIITASGPSAAQAFGEELVKALLSC